MRFLVTGARGQLGEAFAEALADQPRILLGDLPEMDIADGPMMAATVRNFRPDVIVNCAAYTDVDGAEAHPLEALRANAVAVRSLARFAAVERATLVHFSTDFVFDGRGSRPYREDDPVNPESVYACSKLLGEDCAAQAPRHYVLRLSSLFGGSARRAFVDRIVDAALAGREIGVFQDRVVSPSYTRDVAQVALALVAQHAAPGVYHCTANGYCSWLELAQHVAGLLGTPCVARGIPFSNPPGKARRPQFCALSNDRLRAAGISTRSWQDTVSAYVRLRAAEVA